MAINGVAETNLDNRFNRARAAFGRLHSVWSSKLRIFNAYVKSTLLYSNETWLISNTITQKLQVFLKKAQESYVEYSGPTTSAT